MNSRGTRHIEEVKEAVIASSLDMSNCLSRLNGN